MRQGRSSCPICLNIIPNELSHAIQNVGIGVEVGKAAKIGIILYADDIELLVRNKQYMGKLCDLVERWLEEYKMKINVKKSEIDSMEKGAEACINGEAMKEVRQYKYLGYIGGE